MKQDKDLEFLASCKNEDLRTLCDILTYNKDGELRLSEELTDSDAYIKYYPEQMNLMAKELGEELRKFGSNTIKTIFYKGEADSYETILRRVCKKIDVAVSDSDSVVEMERRMLTNVCEHITAKLTNEELRSLADKAGIPYKNLDRQMLIAAILYAMRRNVIFLQEIIVYVAGRLAQMLFGTWAAFACMGTVGRYIGMATGPIGWTVMAGWTLSDIASPAYRVIIPAVIMVASMRVRQTALLTSNTSEK